MVNKIAGSHKVNVITLQETWITDANIHLVNLPGYKHYDEHRKGHKGGGVSVQVSNELTSHEYPALKINENHLESCFVEIKLQEKQLLVDSIYRPPNSDDKKFNETILRIFQKLKVCKNCNRIIGADHNLDLMKSEKHVQMQNFIENVLSNELIPCITRPTRITKSSAMLIDNIITSRNLFDTLTCGIAISGISDHFPCVMTWPKALSKKQKYIEFILQKLDDKYFSNIRQDLNIDWQSFLCMENNANQNFQLFHNKITSVLETYTELKKVRISNKKIIKEP